MTYSNLQVTYLHQLPSYSLQMSHNIVEPEIQIPEECNGIFRSINDNKKVVFISFHLDYYGKFNLTLKNNEKTIDQFSFIT